MMNEAIVILVGLFLMVIVPPFIVYLFKKRKNYDTDLEILESLMQNPDRVMIEHETGEESEYYEEEELPRYTEFDRDERISRVKQYRKTNPRLHFR